MKKNFIISIITALILIPILPLNRAFGDMPDDIFKKEPLLFFLWVIPVVAFFIYAILKSEVGTSNKVLATYHIRKKAFIKTIITFITITVICFYLIGSSSIRNIGSNFGNIGVVNYLFLLLYFFLQQNIVIKAPGYYFEDLHIEALSLLSKFKILILNFFRISPFYVTVFMVKYNIDSNITGKIVMLLAILIALDSSFIYIYGQSYLEKSLGVKIYCSALPSYKKKKRKKTRI